MGPALIQIKTSKSFTPQSQDVSCTFSYLCGRVNVPASRIKHILLGIKSYGSVAQLICGNFMAIEGKDSVYFALNNTRQMSLINNYQRKRVSTVADTELLM